MYEFLKKLFGTVDGQPEALTYEQLEEKIKGDKNLKIVNLTDGGYVAEDKFRAKETELTGVKQQLTDANTTIQSLKDKGADVDKVTKEWEDKYNKDTKDLKDKLTAQERSHQTDMFLSGYNYTSKAAQAGIRAEFEKKNYALENGQFGADATAYMKSLPQCQVVNSKKDKHYQRKQSFIVLVLFLFMFSALHCSKRRTIIYSMEVRNGLYDIERGR